MRLSRVLAVTASTLAPAAALAQAGPQMNIGPPVAQPGWRFDASFGPSFPTGDAGDAADTGIGLRFRFGPEYMWGRIGVTPGGAFHFHYYGAEGDVDGGSIYIGLIPGVNVAAHLGMAAPFAGIGMGFDHFRATGDVADELDMWGADTSASGFGFELLFGTHVWFTPAIAGLFSFQIHPGFTEWEDQGIGFFAMNFGVTFAF